MQIKYVLVYLFLLTFFRFNHIALCDRFLGDAEKLRMYLPPTTPKVHPEIEDLPVPIKPAIDPNLLKSLIKDGA